MKLKILIGICIFILFSSSVFALEEGYPFVGRMVDEEDNGVSGLAIQFVFELKSPFGTKLCISEKMLTTGDGEFVLTINENTDIVYEDGGEPCVAKIKAGDSFYLLIDKSAIGCEDAEEYNGFVVEESASYIGTHSVEDCKIEVDKEYISPSAGGGAKGDKHIKVIRPEEFEEILEAHKGKKPIIIVEEEGIPVEELGLVEEKPKFSFEPNTFFTLALALIVIANLIWLNTQLRKRIKK